MSLKSRHNQPPLRHLAPLAIFIVAAVSLAVSCRSKTSGHDTTEPPAPPEPTSAAPAKLVMTTADSCPACEELRPAFEQVRETYDGPEELHFEFLDLDEAAPLEVSQLDIGGQAPTVALLRGKRVVDRQFGAHARRDTNGHEHNVRTIRHLLARNDLLEAEPSEFLIGRGGETNFPTRSSYVGAAMVAQNRRGADFRGKNLSVACLAGSDLRGADFRNATLRGANLEGAEMQGADLGEVWWKNFDPDTRHEGVSTKSRYVAPDDDRTCPNEQVEPRLLLVFEAAGQIVSAGGRAVKGRSA